MDGQRQISLGLSGFGAIFGLIAIYVFFTAFTLEAWCPEENQREIMRDGEVVISCEGTGMWNGILSRVFLACCVFVPLSTLLATFGVLLRKGQSENTGLEGQTPTGPSESSMASTLQSVAQWFGVGLAGIVIILAVAITVFVLLALHAVFSSGTLFS